MSYQIRSSQVVYRGRVVTLRRDEVQLTDALTVREVVEHPGAVAVVALDDDEQVVMVKQYRHPVGRELEELPAGLLDVEDESALVAAKRELAEETRLQAERWDVLVDLYSSPGMSDEAVRVYLARGLSEATNDDGFVPEHEEVSMTVHRRRLDELVTQVLAGALQNGIAVAGVLAAASARQDGFSRLRPDDAPWPAKPDRGGV